MSHKSALFLIFPLGLWAFQVLQWWSICLPLPEFSHRRCGINPWIEKIPWRRKRQPTPAFLPETFHGQRSLAGCSPWGRKESDMTEQLSRRTQTQRDQACSCPGSLHTHVHTDTERPGVLVPWVASHPRAEHWRQISRTTELLWDGRNQRKKFQMVIFVTKILNSLDVFKCLCANNSPSYCEATKGHLFMMF